MDTSVIGHLGMGAHMAVCPPKHGEEEEEEEELWPSPYPYSTIPTWKLTFPRTSPQAPYVSTTSAPMVR